MTNLDQAAQVIMMCVQKGYGPYLTAETLANYGLLAQDLPEPQFFPLTEEYEWHIPDGYVSLCGEEIAVSYDERDEDDYLTKPAPEQGEIRVTDTGQGRDVAYGILAACNWKDAHDD